MARPKKHLPTNGLDVIRRLASRGVSEVQIAKALGFSYDTWLRIKKENPAAQAAWQESRKIEEEKLVGVLYEQAVGRPAEFDSAGNEIRAEARPYAPAAMFLLKARHGYREIDFVDPPEIVKP